MNVLTIATPAGQFRVITKLEELMKCFRREVLPDSQEAVLITQVLDTTLGNIHAATISETRIKGHVFLPISDNPAESCIEDNLYGFASKRFKNLVAKKNIEFYIRELNMNAIQELSYKFLENMGSQDAYVCIFQLSSYHKFVAIVDFDCFRIFTTKSGKAELVEMLPDKWVLGRYEEDNNLLKDIDNSQLIR